MQIRRKFDVQNLVRELAENKVDALELLREALSNAKDHGATKVWIRISRDDPRRSPSILIVDNGEGMDDERLAAFWGVGASVKSQQGIGYKGHGTKLYFASERLSVATRSKSDNSWRYCSEDNPSTLGVDARIDVTKLTAGAALNGIVRQLGLSSSCGTAIFVEHVQFGDANNLLQRRKIESFCDWFTVIGDVRSGLFDERVEFHKAIESELAISQSLQIIEVPLRPMELSLQINGEKTFTPYGLGATESFKAWPNDLRYFRDKPGVLGFGHRFADRNESAWGTSGGPSRVRDDLTSLRLTSPEDWAHQDGYSTVARVEGHRRQRDTYQEAQWQGKAGVFSFEDRFGLWLCKDFVPIVRRNELLREALNRASKKPLQFELGSLRNWQVFVNHQNFLPTANRNGISNQSEHDQRVVELLAEMLEKKLRDQSFLEWIQRLRSARRSGQRDREVADMDERRQAVKDWIASQQRDAIDPTTISQLPALGPDESLLMRAPRSEQELFYLYGLISGRYKVPLHVLQYDASQGVDAIARLDDPTLISPPSAHARVEFKFVVAANTPIDHFFRAIDFIICWSVGRLGSIYEQSSDDLIGTLRKRKNPLLDGGIDTHEIAYKEGNSERIIPVVALETLFTGPTLRRPRRGRTNRS